MVNKTVILFNYETVIRNLRRFTAVKTAKNGQIDGLFDYNVTAHLGCDITDYLSSNASKFLDFGYV